MSSIPSPKTPPLPPPIQRLGSQTLSSIKNRIWNWCSRVKSLLTLPDRPPSLQSLWSESTSPNPEPSWLSTGGSARQSCVRLWRFISDTDFRLRYTTQQIEDLFTWTISRLHDLGKAGRETAHRLAKLESLVALLDEALACAEMQCQKLLFERRDRVAAKSRPSKTSKTRQSKGSKPRIKKRFAVNSSRAHHQKTFGKKLQELEDSVDKLNDRVRRLMKIARNTENILKQNGCMAEDMPLDASSDSELD